MEPLSFKEAEKTCHCYGSWRNEIKEERNEDLLELWGEATGCQG